MAFPKLAPALRSPIYMNDIVMKAGALMELTNSGCF